MRLFCEIHAEAVERAGGEAQLQQHLPVPRSDNELNALPDSFYLSTMSRRIFRAGLKHKLVDAKWPAFETAFKDFEPAVVARFSDEALEKLAGDPGIIRHFGKIKAVRANAQMLLDIVAEHGSVGAFIAGWPRDSIVELWLYFKKRGAQLGGQSAARFLRMVGKDTFLLTDDVVAALIREGAMDKPPSAQRDLFRVQGVFNQWHAETGRPLCELSRIVSLTAGRASPSDRNTQDGA